MGFLVLNILPHFSNERFAYREREIVVLPIQLSLNKFLLIEPVRRFAFQKHRDISYVLLPPERDQEMQMFGPTIDRIEKDAFIAGVLPDVLAKPLTKLGRQYRFAIFRREDEVYPYADK